MSGELLDELVRGHALEQKDAAGLGTKLADAQRDGLGEAGGDWFAPRCERARQSTTWDQRSIAYNALSNQVLIVSMTNTVTGSSTGEVYVLDGTTGADLYQLNTDASVINSASHNSGNRPILSIDVAADGAVWAGNLTDNGNARGFQLYRWADSASTTPSQLISGPAEPASSPTQFWTFDSG